MKGFTTEIIERNGFPLCFLTNVKVMYHNILESKHATSFYICGKKEY